MRKSHERLAGHVGELNRSMAKFRTALLRYQRAVTRVADHVSAGEEVVQATRAANLADRRRELKDRMDDFESVRRQVRLSLFALGIEEGSSLSEIGRGLGISKQLASRLASELQQVSR
jgi:hypothetical protein